MFGNVMMAVVKVKNDTTEKIGKISLSAEGVQYPTIVKNLKSNKEKQTSISSRGDIKNLIMEIEGIEKVYMISEEVDSTAVDKIVVTIKNITEQDCEFTVENIVY
ncbi:MAG: hypothetical protein ACRCTZ_02230 [Sarcina sp.]